MKLKPDKLVDAPRAFNDEAHTQNPAKPPCSAMWAVMKVYAWDNVTTAHGIPLVWPLQGPQRFIPVFETQEQAAAWAGSDEHVVMMMLGTRHSTP